jgi:hypothetical protein
VGRCCILSIEDIRELLRKQNNSEDVILYIDESGIGLLLGGDKRVYASVNKSCIFKYKIKVPIESIVGVDVRDNGIEAVYIKSKGVVILEKC